MTKPPGRGSKGENGVMRNRCFGVLLGLGVVAPAAAHACEAPLWDPDWGPKSIRVGANCSFDRGGPFAEGDVTGSPVKAFAGQRIFQVITDHYACTAGDQLLVVQA